MSTVIVSVRAEGVITRLAGAPDRLRAALTKTIQRLAIMVQSRVKEKLTGEVLHVRTGTLRRSINQEVKERADGIYAVVGTNVVYAAPHEFGFDGEVTVRAHLRRSKAQFALPSKSRPKKSEGEIFVSQHTRHVVLPERSFLRSTLREYEGQIMTDITAAARKAIWP